MNAGRAVVSCCYCRVTKNGKGSWFKVDGKRMRRDIGLMVWEVTDYFGLRSLVPIQPQS